MTVAAAAVIAQLLLTAAVVATAAAAAVVAEAAAAGRLWQLGRVNAPDTIGRAETSHLGVGGKRRGTLAFILLAGRHCLNTALSNLPHLAWAQCRKIAVVDIAEKCALGKGRDG